MAPDIEGAPTEARFVEAFGQQYEVAEQIGAMAMMRFGKLAKGGMKTGDMDALAAMYDLLRSMFTPSAWERFQEDAIEANCGADELFGAVKDGIEAISSRPTKSPSDSSSGRPTTTPSSTDSSSFEDHKRALGLVPVTDALQELAG